MQPRTMTPLVSGLITQKYTRIFRESPMEMKFNAPHYFEVANVHTGELLQTIHFQEGPILENGVNGVANEDLIAMVICRLENFQQSPYKCRENAIAISKLEEALMWLRKRTNDRAARGVEGTNIV